MEARTKIVKSNQMEERFVDETKYEHVEYLLTVMGTLTLTGFYLFLPQKSEDETRLLGIDEVDKN